MPNCLVVMRILVMLADTRFSGIQSHTRQELFRSKIPQDEHFIRTTATQWPTPPLLIRWPLQPPSRPHHLHAAYCGRPGSRTATTSPDASRMPCRNVFHSDKLFPEAFLASPHLLPPLPDTPVPKYSFCVWHDSGKMFIRIAGISNLLDPYRSLGPLRSTVPSFSRLCIMVSLPFIFLVPSSSPHTSAHTEWENLGLFRAEVLRLASDK